MVKEDKFSQSPFDLYDIFGYIVPGLVFLVSIILLIFYFGVDFPIKNEILSHNNFLSLIELKGLKDNIPWWIEFTILITIIALVYTLGHIIASISSLLVDKYLVKKITGYPSQRLFKLPYNQDFSIGFYKLLVFLINSYMLYLVFFGMPNLYFFYASLIIIAIIILIKIIISKPKKNEQDISTNKTNNLSKIGKAISIPFNFFVKFVERSFGLNDPFNANFISEYKVTFEKQFKMDIESAGTNLYWLSYCYVIDKNEHMREVIRHFLRLYGFTRNLGISFYLLFIYTLILRLSTNLHVYRLTWICIIFFVISVILLIRYYYLYYNYYSKFIFRSFAYIQSNNTPVGADL